MQQHITVLQKEAVEALHIRPDGIYVDATLGSAGHARAIASRLDEQGTLIGVDADPEAITKVRDGQWGTGTVQLVVDNFKNINSVLSKLNIETVDGILADLGWRMEQFSGNGKGFSFQVDEPLLMTLGDPSAYPFTAQDIVNEWKESDLVNVLRAYGEERFAGRIAHAIVEAREVEPITHSVQLANIIKAAVPARFQNGKIHPATKTFQALRITVNDELDTLRTFIEHAIATLAEGGRLAIITFHSLEDRIVKHAFKDLAHDSKGTIITKKPITPSREEILQNPRSRSAKLRIFEKHVNSN